MQWLLRKAVVEDKKRIEDLFIEMLQTIYQKENVDGYEDKYLYKFFAGDEDWICVAEDGGQVVAFLSIEVHREQDEYIYLDDFSVSKDYRNYGIGTELIKKAEEYAKSIGISSVILHVEKSNLAARRLYERMGFEILDDEEHRLKMIKRIVSN